VHTALSRRVTAGIALESVRAARLKDAFRSLGRWEWSNRVNCGRCRARRALVEGYDTRARPFTRSEGRLRVPGQEKTIGARATGGFEFSVGSWVTTGLRPLCRKKQTIRLSKAPDLYGARTAHWYRPSISSHRRPDSAA
jgi:hypothetical protein